MMRTKLIVAVALLLGAGAAHAEPAPAAVAKPARRVAAVAPAAPAVHRPAAPDLAEIVRRAVVTSGTRLPKGASISAVRKGAAADVPAGADRITIEMASPPRRAGTVTASAVLTFWKAAEVAGRVPVTIELSVPPEALIFDLTKGTAISVVVRRGLVEVSAPAVLAVDADVGDVVQVLLRPSGRALRAQVVARDRAVAVEDGR